MWIFDEKYMIYHWFGFLALIACYLINSMVMSHSEQSRNIESHQVYIEYMQLKCNKLELQIELHRRQLAEPQTPKENK